MPELPSGLPLRDPGGFIVTTFTTSRGAGSVARRSAFLVSAAAASLVAASAAHAQDAGDFAPVLEAQGDHPVVVAPTPEIVIADPGTPTTARDPANVTGVGQMIVDEQNGFIGLCTATLINPRTVMFAAHCVNERAANAYGQDSGGQPIGFGFSNNNNRRGRAPSAAGWATTRPTSPASCITRITSSITRSRSSRTPKASSMPTSRSPSSTRRPPGSRPGRCCSRRCPRSISTRTGPAITSPSRLWQ